MHSQLRERIRLMRARLDNAAPVAEIRAESQLFVTPAPVCDRLVTLAEISNRDHILEPSAGTGAILRAIRDTAPEAMCDAVEINSGLVRYLRENFNGVRVQCGDFMEWQPVQYYSRIIMNPPFIHGQDTRNEGKQGPSLPYIPSGSFAKAMLIEGADANASVTGNESTVPMQLRITGLVEMPNSKTYDATGCFVGLEAWGDVSSERAIVRTRNISCLKNGKTIDMPIKGHVSFRGKNGIKGEVVMRNGKILGWAWGAGFVDGIGQGMERASQPAVGLGATAAYGAGDVLKMGIGGGASKAAQTLSDYYIKRAEQYHPVIPIGAGNEVTVVFQDGFQLKTVEEMALEQSQSTAEEGNPESPVPNPPSAESHLNGFNTDQMLKQLGNLNPQQFMSGSQGGGNDGK
ncbi:TPA: F-type conjugal transfer pilus assembly protein TraB [Escherichia coli]|nr:F-type conjugal transfer pilus assembly protein TraB [Escherichia coli]